MRNTELVYLLSCIASLGALCAEDAGASTEKQVAGFLTQMQGEVFLLTYASPTISGPSPRVKFEGEYYTSEVGKPGSKITDGTIVRTSPVGKVKVIYTNGDQFSLGPGSVLRVIHRGESPSMSLKQGSLRGVVDPNGPMKRLKVRTRAATMGVRGTDFIIEDQSSLAGAGTKVMVLRGKVGLAEAEASTRSTKDEPKAAEIAAGQAAQVSAPPAPAPSAGSHQTQKQPVLTPIFQVYTAPKEELRQALEQVKVTPIRLESAPIPEEVKLEIQALEKAAVKVVVSDIKRADPTSQLSADLISDEGSLSIETLENKLETTLIQKAPEKSAPVKPDFESLRNSEDGDVYKKYFDSNGS